MKKVIITVTTAILLTFSLNVSAQQNPSPSDVAVVIQTTKCQSSPASSYRWVATMANYVKYTVTMVVYENDQIQSFIRIKTDDPRTGTTSIEELPVSPGAENVQMYLSENRNKMSVYYYGKSGPVTIDIEDIL
jgi:hypothetical protein